MHEWHGAGKAQRPQDSSLHSPHSRDEAAEQIAGGVSDPLSAATASHIAPIRHSGRTKGSKSVRFSLAGVGQGAAAAPGCEAEMAADESSLLNGKLGNRVTRSGKLHGAEATAGVGYSLPTDLNSAQAGLSQREVEPAASVRITRSGRSFPAGPDQSSNAEASSSRTDTEAQTQSAHDAADRAEGPCSSSPALDPGLSPAAVDAASGENNLRRPWEQSLLGRGLALSRSEDDRLSDRGRPPTTDHPCHKRKSASMTRRWVMPK